ncbi:VWA-like domain-containing protein [Dactylosporangium sp. AC04546]|uniref:vWA domain-containing protein n=1 Tax=Dactylosporangium sp. AC04546 TaxID=2862460 RepID=UPI001EE146DE|nr:VWA-like domain-containing protein [Dactylosporangium sp. AC04546]WVK83534.1 VWA-like domain-containing protein [Dactylosporangium sp. AC04546]
MSDDALRMAAARARAAELMPYLATALYACTPIPTPLVPTAAIDDRWRLYWNPGWCRDLPVIELAGLWLHEVGHVLRDHAARFSELLEPVDRAPVFNVAGDAAINADLDGQVSLPSGTVRVTDIPGAQREMTTEQLYRLLLQQSPTAQADCGSGATPGRRPWELGDDGATEARLGLDPDHADQVRRRVAADVRAHARSSGHLPTGLRRWAEEILEPRVDWRAELNSVVRRRAAEVAGRRDYSYARPSRRAVPDVVLPSMRQPRPPNVYAIVDTSGSMSSAMLSRCLAEIDGITRRSGRGRPSLRVVSCDAATGAIRPVRSAAEVILTGGGGTDLRVGLRTVAESRPRADLVVLLTDGDTPWDPEPPRQNPGATYVVVLVAGDRVTPPWVRKVVVDG